MGTKTWSLQCWKSCSRAERLAQAHQRMQGLLSRWASSPRGVFELASMTPMHAGASPRSGSSPRASPWPPGLASTPATRPP
eukprot:6943516-Alexandrium_andersonii.AAC.1